MTTDKKIRLWIISQLSRGLFVWDVDIMEHVLWGFKSAPYKSFQHALKKVVAVTSAMEAEGLLSRTIHEEDHCSDTFSPGKNFKYI